MSILHKRYPEHEFYFIVGADMVHDLPIGIVSNLIQDVQFVGLNRPGYGRPELPDAIAKRVRYVSMPSIGITSTDIGRKRAAGKSVRYLFPRACGNIWRLIGCMKREKLLTIVKSELDESRYRHTLCVAETAVQLAHRFGADPEKADVAALLHDYSKCWPTDKQRQWIVEHKIGYDLLQHISSLVARFCRCGSRS